MPRFLGFGVCLDTKAWCSVLSFICGLRSKGIGSLNVLRVTDLDVFTAGRG